MVKNIDFEALWLEFKSELLSFPGYVTLGTMLNLSNALISSPSSDNNSAHHIKWLWALNELIYTEYTHNHIEQCLAHWSVYYHWTL